MPNKNSDLEIEHFQSSPLKNFDSALESGAHERHADVFFSFWNGLKICLLVCQVDQKVRKTSILLIFTISETTF